MIMLAKEVSDLERVQDRSVNENVPRTRSQHVHSRPRASIFLVTFLSTETVVLKFCKHKVMNSFEKLILFSVLQNKAMSEVVVIDIRLSDVRHFVLILEKDNLKLCYCSQLFAHYVIFKFE